MAVKCLSISPCGSRAQSVRESALLTIQLSGAQGDLVHHDLIRSRFLKIL